MLHSHLSTAEIANELRLLVGDDVCLTDAESISPFLADYRGIYRGNAAAVVRPRTVEEISKVLHFCNTHRVSVVPQGGNTSLAGAAVPERDGKSIVLSLTRLSRVIEVDLLNDTLTAEAGCTLSQVREAALEAGRIFPLRIGSEGSCQIGGNLSTNAGGTAVLKYGNMRELTLGLEVVLPDGRIWSSLRGLRKDNSGYDLKQLFIGSEGTLGVITKAVLKMSAAPTAKATALVSARDLSSAIELLSLFKSRAGQNVATFELISPEALKLVLDHLALDRAPLPNNGNWQVLIELMGSGESQSLDTVMQSTLEEAMELGLANDAALASNELQAQHMLKIREEISDAQTRARGSVRCDVSVPISRMAEFIEAASSGVRALVPDIRMIVYGHVGDGNVHFNPLRPSGMNPEPFLAEFDETISYLVDKIAVEMKGSISAEHGIGVAKRNALAEFKSETDLGLMRAVKAAIDPNSIMNPAKILI